MHFIFLQLPFFDKEESECDNYFERWIYVLKNMSNLSRMPWVVQDGVFAKLAEIADVERMSDKERRVYDEMLKVYRDYHGIMDGAKIEGREEGREEGRAEGLEEGMEKGRAEGKKNTAIEIAKKMKKKGMDIDSIKDLTDLSAEEIEAIKIDS